MYDNVKLIQNSEALNGTQRVLLDDVISEDECTELKSLAHVRPYLSILACSVQFSSASCGSVHKQLSLANH